MFTPPVTEPSAAKQEAKSILEKSNVVFGDLLKYYKSMYMDFWYVSGRMRSASELNAVLAEMDIASQGQSVKFVKSAGELSEFLLALSPDCLGVEEYGCKYQYSVDEQGLRFSE